MHIYGSLNAVSEHEEWLEDGHFTSSAGGLSVVWSKAGTAGAQFVLLGKSVFANQYSVLENQR